MIWKRNTVLARHMNEPVVLLVKLFVAKLTAELEARLMNLLMELQAALRAQAFATPAARQAFHVIVTLGIVLLLHVQREKSATRLTIEFCAIFVLFHMIAMRHGRHQTFAAHRALKGGLQRVLGSDVIGQNGQALTPRGVVAAISYRFPARLIAAQIKGTGDCSLISCGGGGDAGLHFEMQHQGVQGGELQAAKAAGDLHDLPVC